MRLIVQLLACNSETAGLAPAKNQRIDTGMTATLEYLGANKTDEQSPPIPNSNCDQVRFALPSPMLASRPFQSSLAFRSATAVRARFGSWRWRVGVRDAPR